MVKRKRSYGRKTRRIRRRFTKRSRRGGKYSLVRAVRAQITKMAETKFIRLAIENQNLNHNTGLAGTNGPVVYGNLLRTNVGTTQNDRVGDTVWARYLNMRIWLSTKADRPNVMFRIMVIASPPDQSNTSDPVNFWRNYSGNRMLDYVNTDKYSIVYQKIVKITHGDTSFEISPNQLTNPTRLHEVSKMVYISIPLNRKLNYQTDTGGTPTPKGQRNCLSLVIIPYDAFGTLSTDNIASYAMCGLFTYKDF